MRQIFRLVLALAVAIVIANGSRAQQPDKFSRTNVFTFAPAPAPIDLTEIPRGDIDIKLGAKAELKLRPNTATELYLWVLNPNDGDPKKDKDEFTIEMQAAKGGPVVRTKAVIPASTWARVRLPKPPAPAAPATPAPAAPAADGKAPAAATEPPPPGSELSLAGGQSRLTFRLLDRAGNEILDTNGNGKPYGGDYTVSLRPPTDYVETPVTTVTPGKGSVSMTATVTQRPFGYPGSAVVQLLIPPQDALRGSFIRDGFYRRTLTFDNRPTFTPANPAPSVTLSGRIENPGEKVRVYVGIDGIDRAFGYTLDLLGKTPETQIIRETKPEVRIARVGVPAATAPVTRYPVLIEVDNASDDDSLEFRLRPIGKGPELTEVVKLDSVRDVHIWLDTAGPKDGGLLFTTRSRDWVKPLDLSHLQGKIEVLGALRTKTGVVESQRSLVLTVDGTPPELVAFLPIEKELEKGKPLVLAATVNDPDTAVSKATFFLFKALDDGKIPADAVKAVGTQSLKNPKVWAADLKVPADFRGDGLVAVVFANEVGLFAEPLVQRIEIVDPKPPLGTIEGAVTFGERLQPGVNISLRDADGKEKAGMTTDAKGKFKIERVPVGSYRLIAHKKDSSAGALGTLPVVVEAGKTTKAPIVLEKIRR